MRRSICTRGQRCSRKGSPTRVLQPFHYGNHGGGNAVGLFFFLISRSCKCLLSNYLINYYRSAPYKTCRIKGYHPLWALERTLDRKELIQDAETVAWTITSSSASAETQQVTSSHTDTSSCAPAAAAGVLKS